MKPYRNIKQTNNNKETKNKKKWEGSKKKPLAGNCDIRHSWMWIPGVQAPWVTAPWVTHWHLELQALSTLQCMWEKNQRGLDPSLSPHPHWCLCISLNSRQIPAFLRQLVGKKKRLESEVKALDWSPPLIGCLILRRSSHSYFLICKLGEIPTHRDNRKVRWDDFCERVGETTSASSESIGNKNFQNDQKWVYFLF